MSTARARIVVRVTPKERCRLQAKARRLGVSLAQLMRAGAASYEPAPEDLLALAQAAQESIDRAIAAVDASMISVARSNGRIGDLNRNAMQAAAARSKIGFR